MTVSVSRIRSSCWSATVNYDTLSGATWKGATEQRVDPRPPAVLHRKQRRQHVVRRDAVSEHRAMATQARTAPLAAGVLTRRERSRADDGCWTASGRARDRR